MPRQPRRLQHADIFHVVNRATLRMQLFQTASDYQLFVDLLGRAVDKYDLHLWAYCVMPTHWHLLVAAVNASELSRSMQWLTSVHAMRWCRLHPRPGPGPVYQDRFFSVPVQAGIHMYRVARYVERNAMAADLTRRAEDWRWCSAHQRLSNSNSPRLQTLELLPFDAWVRYLNEPVVATDIGDAIRRNWPIGDESWIRARRIALGLPEPRLPGRPRKL